MSTNFRSQIRLGKLASPTSRKFDLRKWNKSWETHKNDEEEHIYLAGLKFHEILGSVRAEIKKLYENNYPGISTNRLLELYCHLSNREIAVLYNSVRKENLIGKNINSVTLTNNLLENKLTIEDISLGAIDAFKAAIMQCIKRQDKEKLKPGKEKIKPLEFARKELLLSSLYNSYEQYFESLIWGDYKYSQSEKKITISQTASEYELAIEVGNIRKIRLSSINSYHFFNIKDELPLGSLDVKYLRPKNENGRISLNVEPLKDTKSLEKIIVAQRIFDLPTSLYEFPESLINNTISEDLSFSIEDAINVFSQISIIAHQLMIEQSKLCDTAAYNMQTISRIYNSSFTKSDLIKNISATIKISHSKAKKILEFIIFNDPKKDIWSHPIIKTKDGSLEILIAAAAAPNATRVIEHWISYLYSNDQISEKGKSYEDTVILEINKSLINNKIISDYSKAESKTININGEREQIDIAFRIGRVIVICELKCIVSTDSPHSNLRVKERVVEGVSQAKRKSSFISKDLHGFFRQMRWPFVDNTDYEVIPLVINSNRLFAGFPIEEIPITDEKILTNYFKRNFSPILNSSGDIDDADVKYILYNNFEELQKNIYKYLMLPPAIEGEHSNFTKRQTKIFTLSGEELLFEDLVYNSDHLVQKKINSSISFPVYIRPGFDISKYNDALLI